MSPVRERRPECPHAAEVDRGRILKSHGIVAAAVVGVDELDAVWRLTSSYRQLAVALRGVRLIRYHTFDDARRLIEISRDTP